MENKYYTPNITEFYVGFECEFFNNQQDKIWKKEICDEDAVSIAYTTYEHGTSEWEDNITKVFRVKYLDKEDIESLGFKQIEYNKSFSSSWATQFEKKDYILYLSSIHIDSNSKALLIGISIKDKVRCLNKDMTYKEVSIFRGFIKNKSELKVLLRQLNIRE